MTIRVLGEMTTFLFDSIMLIDAGEVIDSLSLKEQHRIKHILLTHSHMDHIRDLPLLVDNRLNNHTHIDPVEIYGGQQTINNLKEHIFNDVIWPDISRLNLYGRPPVRFIELIPMHEVTIGPYTVLPISVEHSVESLGYIIKDRFNRVIAYTSDTGPTDVFWREIKKKGVQEIIAEVSFPDEMRSTAVSSGHLCPGLLKEALEKNEINPNALYITHVKPCCRDIIQNQIHTLFGTSRAILLHRGFIINL